MYQKIKKYIPLGGPIAAIIIWCSSAFPTSEMNTLAGLMVWVVWWWIFTSIPLHITGILAVCLAIFIGLETEYNALLNFSNPLIYLFMGGFILAKAMEVNLIHKRIALTVISSKIVDRDPKKILIAILLMTCFMSMWISNTATVAIMLPIFMGIIGELNLKEDQNQYLILSLGYAATIGGLGTPIGSAPNTLAMGMLNSLMNIKVGFFEYMKYSTPVLVLTMLFLFWYLFKKVKLDSNEKIDVSFAKQEIEKLGKVTSKEKLVFVVLGLTIFGWVLPSLSNIILGKESEIANWIGNKLPESTVVLATSMLLFLFPLGGSKKTSIKWSDAATIDWGTLLLFGSGIALGKMMFVTGLAKYIGDHFFSFVPSHSVILFLVALTAFTITFTEFVSNTAAANLLIPIIIPVAANYGISPLVPVLATAMGCNLAFCFPISTPPNAMVYATGKVELKSMVRMGTWLNFACTIIISLVLWMLI